MLHRARWRELPPETAYRILALRAEVFVVEQSCAYLDPDGADLSEGAEHRWIDEPLPAPGRGGLAAYLRVIEEPGQPGTRRIGRVVVRRERRRRGLAAGLVASVVDDLGATSVLVLSAQSHLVDWYGRFGFTVDGPCHDEDGIAHTPMRRPRTAR